VLTERQARHQRLSTVLTNCDDAELAGGAAVGVGIGGGAAVLDVAGDPVFVKRVPLTDRELAHPQATANLFGLPTCCQYGIGSPGFTAWRELAANRIVTAAVLAGETESFPLLHHWRVLPGRPPVADEHADLDAAVAAWGGHPAVRERLTALAGATHSLVLCFEHLPRSLADRLATDPLAPAEAVEAGLAEIVAVLRRHDLLHFDGHFGNLRADADRIYLTDFGLATSPRFDLAPDERAFVAAHADHDADYAAMRLVNWLVSTGCGVTDVAERNAHVRRCAAGTPADLPPAAAAVVARHAPAAARLNEHYWRLFDGDLHAEYPSAPVRGQSDSR
jgi:hypothetical protein